MEAIKIENNVLKLPDRIVKKLKGKRLEVTEVKEGILLKTVGNPITEARGFLRGRQFTTDRYMQLKKVEKEFE